MNSVWISQKRDRFAHPIDLLRISITDLCNERCLYCSPLGFLPKHSPGRILDFSEILKIARVSVELGIRNIRLTGGEPLARKGTANLVKLLAEIPGLESIGMTTNGTLLAQYANVLREAGLHSINVSLDAISPAIYQMITRHKIEPVLAGIEACRAAGFSSIKLNMVLMRGINDSEILPLVDFAAERNLILRFIELMPMISCGPLSRDHFFSIEETKNLLTRKDSLIPLNQVQLGHGPAEYFRLQKTDVIVGFIGAMTNFHFCDNCNKIRLTADGKIRPCLGNSIEYDLKPALENSDSVRSLRQLILQILEGKPVGHLFRTGFCADRSMTAIGG